MILLTALLGPKPFVLEVLLYKEDRNTQQLNYFSNKVEKCCVLCHHFSK